MDFQKNQRRTYLLEVVISEHEDALFNFLREACDGQHGDEQKNLNKLHLQREQTVQMRATGNLLEGVPLDSVTHKDGTEEKRRLFTLLLVPFQ